MSATTSRKKKAAIPLRRVKKATAAAPSAYVAKKNEKYMSKRQQDYFRKKLIAWRQELFDEIARTVHQLRDEPDNPPDMNDRASLETDMSLELRSRDRERKLIKKIDEAITRLDRGEYGYCDECGVEIGFERLDARPTAELCIDCKTLGEIREKQMG